MDNCRLVMFYLLCILVVVPSAGGESICPSRSVDATSSGVISSPNYPEQIIGAADCTLTLTVPMYSTITFTAGDKYHLPAAENSDTDCPLPKPTEVHHLHLIRPGTVTQLCGTSQPGASLTELSTDGQEVQIQIEFKFANQFNYDGYKFELKYTVTTTTTGSSTSSAKTTTTPKAATWETITTIAATPGLSSTKLSTQSAGASATAKSTKATSSTLLPATSSSSSNNSIVPPGGSVDDTPDDSSALYGGIGGGIAALLIAGIVTSVVVIRRCRWKQNSPPRYGGEAKHSTADGDYAVVDERNLRKKSTGSELQMRSVESKAYYDTNLHPGENIVAENGEAADPYSNPDYDEAEPCPGQFVDRNSDGQQRVSYATVRMSRIRQKDSVDTEVPEMIDNDLYGLQ